MDQTDTDKVKSDVLAVVGFFRSMTIDIIEIELGDQPSWPYVRSKLLRAFGERGLEGRILAILCPSKNPEVLK